MNTYANGFNCTVNDDKSEAVLTFFQHTPQFNDQGELDSVKRETVSTVFLTREIAAKLSATISSLLNEQ